MDFPAHQRPRAKLLHAIVGLGLVAASCGGKAASEDMRTSAIPGQDAGTSSSSQLSSSSGSLTSPDDASVADADDAADSTMNAADGVATDVAAEAWIPVPIR